MLGFFSLTLNSFSQGIQVEKDKVVGISIYADSWELNVANGPISNLVFGAGRVSEIRSGTFDLRKIVTDLTPSIVEGGGKADYVNVVLWEEGSKVGRTFSVSSNEVKGLFVTAVTNSIAINDMFHTALEQSLPFGMEVKPKSFSELELEQHAKIRKEIFDAEFKRSRSDRAIERGMSLDGHQAVISGSDSVDSGESESRQVKERSLEDLYLVIGVLVVLILLVFGIMVRANSK